MNPKGAKPYLNPEMMGNFADLMGVTDLQVTPAEAAGMSEANLDALYTAYFKFFCEFGQEPDFLPREWGSSKMPLTTRAGLRNWLLTRIVTQPDDAHRRLNALLAKKDHLFIDPFTEEPFKFPVIPRCAFPEKPLMPMAENWKQVEPKWRETRAKIMGEAKKASAPKGGSDAARLGLANAELAAARMRAQAVANANAETKVYDQSSGKYMGSYTPGNF